jgi:predicted RNA-binding protein YlqC (UPF0109 family)
MNALNQIKNLLEHMAASICDHPENLKLDYKSMATLSIKIDIICDETDKPHLIGRNGNTIQAIRTILHSTAAKDGWKTYISVT